MNLFRWLEVLLVIGLAFYIFYNGVDTLYICPDKTVVTDALLCKQELQITGYVIKSTRYVCPDGNIVENPDDCDGLRKIILREYVCNNGTIVINPSDCLPRAKLSESNEFESNISAPTIFIPEIPEESTSTTTTTTKKITTTTTKSTARKTTTTTTTIKQSSPTSCISLGCDSSTKYVGSKNSDKYYPCDSGYAKMVKRENIVCFTSDEDARSKGYVPCKRC